MILAFKNVISQIDVNVFFSIFEYYKLVKLQIDCQISLVVSVCLI